MKDDGFARSTPEAQGIDSARISTALDHIRDAGVELHSMMLLRNAQVIAEGWWSPYGAQRRHMLHSATKSFTATGVGLAIAEGAFGLDDKVVSFFPESLPSVVSDNLAEMRVRHLLSMTTGHEAGISGGAWRGRAESWISLFLREPVVEPPGQRFVYSSASSFMLSAIVQRTTGQKLVDFLAPRLFTPLGITDVAWDTGSDDVTSGGNGLSLRTVDLAKLGLLHLQQGLWNNQRVLPQSWISTATSPMQTNVWMGSFDGRKVLVRDEDDPRSSGQRYNGYGYHWWTGPDGAFYAWGIFGQYCIVLPRQNVVVALTGAVGDPESTLLDLVWIHLVPAVTEHGGATRPDQHTTTLRQRLASLELLQPMAASFSPLAGDVSQKRFRFGPNDDDVSSVTLSFEGDRYRFELVDRRGVHLIEGGIGAWVEGTTTMTGNMLHHQYQPEQLRVVAGGTWSSADEFRMIWIFVETAFRDEVRCIFRGTSVVLTRSVNVNTSGRRRPEIVGTLTEFGA